MSLPGQTVRGQSTDRQAPSRNPPLSVRADAARTERGQAVGDLGMSVRPRDERQPIGLARQTASRVSPVRATPVAMIPRHGLLGGSRPVAAEPLQSLARALPTFTTCTCAMRLRCAPLTYELLCRVAQTLLTRADLLSRMQVRGVITFLLACRQRTSAHQLHETVTVVRRKRCSRH